MGDVFQVTTRTAQPGAREGSDCLGRPYWRANYDTAAEALAAALSGERAEVWYHFGGVAATGRVVSLETLEQWVAA